MKNLGRLAFLSLIIGSMIIINGCIDQEFDAPPGLAVQEEDISNTTIAELKSLFNPDQAIPLTDQVIKGVVISDDTEGNFFKDLIIQDETGGILIRIDVSDLNITYPRGRLVYVNCADLYLGNFGGLIQIGIQESGENVGRIPEAEVEKYLIIGPKDQVVTPTIKSLASLSETDMSTLIELQNVEYSNGELGNTMAEAGAGGTQNRTVRDCDGNEITFRNSDFADFAAEPIPSGNGSVIGVFSIFGTTPQFTIRDMADMDLIGERCDGSGGGGGSGGTGGQLSIASLRSAFQSGANEAPTGFVVGTVISDIENGNTQSQNLYLHDGSAGITVRFGFGTDHNYTFGSQIKVNVGGVELSEFSGQLQLDDTPSQNVTDTFGLEDPPIIDICVGDLVRDFEDYESSIVRLRAVTIDGNDGIYSFVTSVSDNSGTITMFTRSDASFANESLPSQEVDLIGVATDFDAPQVFIRNLNDVQQATSSDCMGGGTGGDGDCTGIFGDQTPVTSVSEDFQGLQDNTDIMQDGWSNINCKGARLWHVHSFSGDSFAEMESFQDSDPEADAWLITPALDLNSINSMNFETEVAFYRHDAVVVLISTNFDGQDVEAADWEELDAEIAGPNQDNFDRVASGNIDLSTYSGTVHVAWRYRGTAAENTTKFRVDNVVIN